MKPSGILNRDPFSLLCISSVLTLAGDLPLWSLLVPLLLAFYYSNKRFFLLLVFWGCCHGQIVGFLQGPQVVASPEFGEGDFMLLEDYHPHRSRGQRVRVLKLYSYGYWGERISAYRREVLIIQGQTHYLTGDIIRLQGGQIHHFNPQHASFRRAFWKGVLGATSDWPKDKRGLWLSLICGYRGLLDYETGEAFRVAGAAPLLALSGLHLGLLVLLLSWIPHRVYRYFTQLCLIWFFLYLIGPSPSLLRGALLFSIAGLGRIFRFQMPPGITLGWAYLGQSLIFPQEVSSLSFILSYGAVAGIFYIKPLLDVLLIGCLPRKIREGVTLPVAVQVLTAPVLLSRFHVIYLGGLISNTLLVLPLIAFLLTGFLALFLPDGILFLEKSGQFLLFLLRQCGKIPPLYPW